MHVGARVASLSARPGELIAFNEVFEELTELDARTAEIAKLRIFAGLTVPETAEVLNLGRRTVDREWALARAWLRTHLIAEQATPRPQRLLRCC